MNKQANKYASLIKAAKEEGHQPVESLENQKSGKPEPKRVEKSKAPETQEEQVNLGVKVPLTWRRHWAAESKRTGISMTEVIIEALTKKFGKPE